MLVATQEGVWAAVAFGFLAGGAAVYLARALGRLIDRWSADDADPMQDPRNWH
jgi:hypothetical protein